MDQTQVTKSTHEDEISIRDIIIKTRSGLRYLKSKWLIILLFSVIGGSLGVCYSLTQKNNYNAICTFVLDEGSGKSSLGQFSGLASLAGINMSSGGGMFEGDNILELYKSRLMIQKALLSEIQINGKKQLLIDRYIESDHLKEKWEKAGLKNLSFKGDPAQFDRTQDSIISDLVSIVNKKILNVTKPDKKLSVIDVQVTSTDELFAKEFTNKIVENVNSFYILTKTKKTLQNVTILQHQVDSVRAILNNSINGVASAIDATPNANPTITTLRVPSQKRQIDVQANSTIYAEMVKNLEVAKISLRQETPLIQVIDKPILPLPVDRVGKVKSAVVGIFLGMFLIIILISVKKAYEIVMQ